jgi:hypothetical protein
LPNLGRFTVYFNLQTFCAANWGLLYIEEYI